MDRRAFGSVLLGPVNQSPRSLRIRVQLLLTSLLIVTNLIGAGIVFLLAVVVIPGPRPNSELALALAISVPVYIGSAVLIGAVWGTTVALRSLRWAIEDAEPDERERREALRVPWALTRMQFLLWAAAVGLFTGLELWLQPSRALTTSFTVAITAIVVPSIAYLLSEFALRPVAARALSDGVPVGSRAAGVGRRMLVFWWLGTGVPVLGLILVSILSLTRDNITLTKLNVVVLVIGAVVLTFGLFVTWLNARAIVSPIKAVRDAMQKVEEGDFDAEVSVYDGSELGRLQAGFNRMVGGLREREHLRDLFGRHVGRDVASAAAAGTIELGGETRVVSVLFVDLTGSTGFATRRTPAEVVSVLNRFFGVVVDEVDAHGGLVNKFMGDAVLAIFGAPADLEDHAGRALAAARTMAARLAEEVPEIGAGIGIATGEAVAGNVGAHSRFEYTVIGDAVNAASRLTDLAKAVDGSVLAMWETVEAAAPGEAERWRRHDDVRLRGRASETSTAVPC